jgi:hypothetical protein
VRGVDYARCVATLLSQEVVVITCLAFCPCCSTTTSCSLDIIACIWRSKDRGLSRPAVFPASRKIYLFGKLLVPQLTRRTAVSFLYPSSRSPIVVYYFRWTVNRKQSGTISYALRIASNARTSSAAASAVKSYTMMPAPRHICATAERQYDNEDKRKYMC